MSASDIGERMRRRMWGRYLVALLLVVLHQLILVLLCLKGVTHTSKRARIGDGRQIRLGEKEGEG
eukprot:1736897-Rhodomonas_salina.1